MQLKWRCRRRIYCGIAASMAALTLWVIFNAASIVSSEAGEEDVTLPPQNNATPQRQALCNHSLPEAPTFLMVGTQKGGTTALRNILVQHPSMIASQEFERHYFDKKMYRYLLKTYQSETLQDEWICDVRRHYIQSTWHATMLEKAANEPLFFYEKTPSYLVDPDVPQLVHRICPWTKIVVVLRDPIQRAYSHYKMEREKLRVKVDFAQAVQQEIQRLKEHGLLVSNAAGPEGLQTIPSPKDNSDDAHKRFLNNYTNTNFLQRGMYSVQLFRWLRYFTLGESLLVLKFEELQADPARVYSTILDFLGAPRVPLPLQDLFKSYNTRGQFRRKMDHAPIDNQTQLFLEQFFQPYNEQLALLLGEKLH